MGNEAIRENNNNKDNILFIGNGLDRLAGYNTDYPSFLKYYMSHYIKALEGKYIKLINDRNYFIKTGKVGPDIKLLLDQDLCKLIIEEQIDATPRSELSEEIKTAYYKDKVGTLQKLVGDLGGEFSLNNLEIPTLSNDVYNKSKERDVQGNLNSWLVYFQYLWLKGQERGENWADLEHVIFLNSKLGLLDGVNPQIESYEKVVSKLEINSSKKIKERDFKEMKDLLTHYLKNEKRRELEFEIDIHTTQLDKYGTVLNFNYGTTYCVPKKSGNEFWIHGNLEDGKNIVFGYDDGMLIEKSIERRHPDAKDKLYQYKTDMHKQFSKTHQLLNLTTYYQNEKSKRNIKLPSKTDVIHIGILGHGVGAADYNYFETLCDFNSVKIEVFWYTYEYHGKDRELHTVDNKAELLDSVMKMLQEMESRLGYVIAHKMLIEQRIIFTELNYEVIETSKK